MPYASKAQMRFMHAKHPEIAKEFDQKTKEPKNLPNYAHGKPKKPQPKSPWLSMKKGE